MLAKKRIVLITRWAWPFGGGEEFMLQSMHWCAQLGIEAVWLDFCSGTNVDHPRLTVDSKTAPGTIVHLPGGFSEETIRDWLILLKPDLVHHQGHCRMAVMQVCRQLRVPMMTGFHFWIGAIELSAETQNSKILSNVSGHKISPELEPVDEYCTVYAASEFVQEVIATVAKIHIEHIIYPISSAEFGLVKGEIVPSYVTMVNIHRNKGGELLDELLTTAPPHLNFWGIHTEWLLSGDLDKSIKEKITSRPGSKFSSRMNDVTKIYAETGVLLVSSIVDETFCRVALEGMMNGIPIISTGAGNIINLLGKDYPYLVPDASRQTAHIWLKHIIRLTQDQEERARVSALLRKRADLFSESIAIQQFSNCVSKALEKGGNKNVMVICPWGDQGLGNQSANYVKALELQGYRSHVFSFRNYNQVGDKPFQRNPADWDHPRVFYSQHNREQVPDEELIQFVNNYHIRYCIFPETCWFRVFEIAKLLRSLGVKVSAVPNIEIVREDELSRHRYFEKILMNNQLCERIFTERGFKNLSRVAYSLPDKLLVTEDKSPIHADDHKKIRLLLVGGTNAFSRKQALQVIEAFNAALETEPKLNVELTITVQANWDSRADIYCNRELYPSIRLLREHLSHAEVYGLIDQADIIIQVSRQEGLGLGFYETLARGKPCVTLATQPHNEIIKPKYGWSIPCTYEPMTDNSFGLIGAAIFQPNDLTQLLLEIFKNPSEIDVKRSNILARNKRHVEQQHYKKWSRIFVNAVVE